MTHQPLGQTQVKRRPNAGQTQMKYSANQTLNRRSGLRVFEDSTSCQTQVKRRSNAPAFETGRLTERCSNAFEQTHLKRAPNADAGIYSTHKEKKFWATFLG